MQIVIELHKIYVIKLSGERVFVVRAAEPKEQDFHPDEFLCRRLVHTHDDGDIYRVDWFHPDELMSVDQHQSQLNSERVEMAKLFQRHGITILGEDNPLSGLMTGEKN